MRITRSGKYAVPRLFTKFRKRVFKFNGGFRWIVVDRLDEHGPVQAIGEKPTREQARREAQAAISSMTGGAL